MVLIILLGVLLFMHSVLLREAVRGAYEAVGPCCQEPCGHV
jgi:hypothetical protein